MTVELFRTKPTRARPRQGVSRRRKSVLGAKIIQLGKLNDSRPWEVDDETLAAVISAGNANPKGLKARFTHPSMSDDGFGKYLGRWKNFRREGDAVLADLHISQSAFDTPHGDLGGYVMALAEEDPEAFGVSIATKLSEAMYQEPEEPGQVLSLRFDKLLAADVVDEPAATRGGLFGIDVDESLPRMATWVLNHHFAGVPRESVEARLSALLDRHFGRKAMETAPEAVQAPTTEPASAEVLSVGGDIKEAARPFVEAFGDRGAVWFLEGRDLLSCFKDQNKELGELCAKQQAEIEDLRSKLSAALSAGGEVEPLSASVQPEHVSKHAARVAELKSKGYPDSLARWTAAFAVES